MHQQSSLELKQCPATDYILLLGSSWAFFFFLLEPCHLQCGKARAPWREAFGLSLFFFFFYSLLRLNGVLVPSPPLEWFRLSLLSLPPPSLPFPNFLWLTARQRKESISLFKSRHKSETKEGRSATWCLRRRGAVYKKLSFPRRTGAVLFLTPRMGGVKFCPRGGRGKKKKKKKASICKTNTTLRTRCFQVRLGD